MKQFVIPATAILVAFGFGAADAQTRPANRHPHQTAERQHHNRSHHTTVHRDVNVNVNVHNRWHGNVYAGPRVAVARYHWPHGYHYRR